MSTITDTQPSPSTMEMKYSNIPRPHPDLVLKLREASEKTPSWYSQTYESIKAKLHPDDMAKEMEQDLEKGAETLTADQAEAMNKRNRERIQNRMHSVVNDLCEATKVKAGDSVNLAELKQAVVDSLLVWLRDLFKWLVAEIKVVFDQVLNNIKLAITKAKDLFTILYESLSNMLK
jgi:hypothetical protein